MSTNPFSLPGKFWKGNLHTHSTMSDGELEPAEVCRRYREQGYDFLALTDHFLERYGFPITDTEPYRTSEFTTILGAELHSGKTDLGHMWHILAVGLPLDFTITHPMESGPELAARALSAGAFVAAAHPAWYGLTENDIASLGPIHAIEIYNGTSADHNDRPDSWYIADVFLMKGSRYSFCATDDAHFRVDRHDSGRGWVHVKSEENSPESLLTALKDGNYYSSTGPEIYDVQKLPGNRLKVRCSQVERIMATGYGYSVSSAWGNGITEAELNLGPLGDSGFFRVTVRDSRGGRAWSNPFWL